MKLAFWRPTYEPAAAGAATGQALGHTPSAAFDLDAELGLPPTGEPEPDVEGAYAAAINPAAEPPVNPVAARPAVPDASPGRADDKRRDRSLYQALLAGLYDAIIITDPAGIIISSNPRMETLFGYAVDKLWDVRCEKLIPAMRTPVLTKIRTHAAAGRFSIVNASCVRQDGSVFPAEIAINRITLFNEGDLLFSVRSIERRVRAKDRKALDAAVMDCTAAGVVVSNQDGVIEAANHAFLQMVGLEQESDVLQRFAGEFCMSHEASSQLLLKSPAGASRWIGRIRLRHQGAHSVEAMATAARTMADRGEHVQIVLTFTPIPRQASLVAPGASAP